MFKPRLISYLIQIVLFGLLSTDCAWAVSGTSAPTPKTTSMPSSGKDGTRPRKTNSTAKSKSLPNTPSIGKSVKAPKGTKTKAPVAKVGLDSKAKSPNKQNANRVGPTKPSTKAPKVSQAVSLPKKPAAAKSTSGDKQTGKKTPSKNAKKAPKEKKPKALDTAEQNPETQTLDENSPSDDSDETNWLTIVLGVTVLALGAGGLFWYRSKKNVPRIDSTVDLQSDVPGVSNFVSNVTAFEFDAPTEAGAKPERRGKESTKKKGRERVSDQVSLTQADQRMTQDTPYASTESSQRFHSNPPASGAPSQIVVPRKAKPPAA